MSYSLKDLRALPIDKLIAEHDNHAQHTSVGVQFYLDEVARRDAEQANKAAQSVADAALAVATTAAQDSAVIKKLTLVITVLTAANVVAAVALLIDALK